MTSSAKSKRAGGFFARLLTHHAPEFVCPHCGEEVHRGHVDWRGRDGTRWHLTCYEREGRSHEVSAGLNPVTDDERRRAAERAFERTKGDND